jgi:hypothetical protein
MGVHARGGSSPFECVRLACARLNYPAVAGCEAELQGRCADDRWKLEVHPEDMTS